MKNKNDPEDKSLRRRAEDKYQQKKMTGLPPINEAELKRLVYELQVHQIELEIQNEELAGARQELELLLHQYTDLYDFAPLGYFTLARDGKIQQVNLYGAKMLGVERSRLIGQSFMRFIPIESIFPFENFFRKIFESQAKEASEIKLSRGGQEQYGQVVGQVTEDGQACRMAIMEITERKQAQKRISEALEYNQILNGQLERVVDNLKQSQQDLEQLRQMSSLLQICSQEEEAYAVIQQFAPQLFPDTSGGVFMTDTGKPMVSARVTWGNQLASQKVFLSDTCWSLRLRHTHAANTRQNNLICQHIDPAFSGFYVDISIVAAGDTLGLLHLDWQNPDGPGESKLELAQNVAENIALAISNLRLRETLRSQSVRDHLTGLFNRRYMEETLYRELTRAARKSLPVALIMIDIDYFKILNDQFGHAAGDLALINLANLLQTHVRGGDLVCRIGGDEFIVILPETRLDSTLNRAEKIRTDVQAMKLVYASTPLGGITVSAGIALFPEDGSTIEQLLKMADQALYRAKNGGRNRVEGPA